jgi:type VI secretion system ImpC/EvpB family protein
MSAATAAPGRIASQLEAMGLTGFDPVTLEKIEMTANRLPAVQRDSVPAIIENLVAEDPNFLDGSMIEYINDTIADLRALVDAQESAILHDIDYLILEALHADFESFLFADETRDLKVKLIMKSKADVVESLADAGGAVDHTPLYRWMCREEFHRPGGNPYRFVVVGEHVGRRDVSLVRTFAEIGAECQCVTLFQTLPSLVCGEPLDGEEAGNPHSFRNMPEYVDDLELAVSRDENIAFRTLQSEPIMRHAALHVDRRLVRTPYEPGSAETAARGLPHFREACSSLNDLLFGGVHVLTGRAIAASLRRLENPTGILGHDSGGRVLVPMHVQLGGPVMLEAGVDEIMAPALARQGFCVDLPWKGKNYVVKFDAPSGYLPPRCDTERETADARIGARLQYVLLANQMGLRLKERLRYECGKTTNAKLLRDALLAEFVPFVCGDPANATPEMLAQRPFLHVHLHVEPDPATPGRFKASLVMVPVPALVGADLQLRVSAEVGPNKP